ncbi:PREDICTED: uncharacterized protein LOC109237240 [Nicotiana attenuata]|uniref:uncharacterized protein LOC109237240 n=1 Tax=Nicotiana attenuata TaxID=49451 RepID=UPI000905BF9F|nr:PREDICTED: uncharacterized protein LOC109237240 [Nicotiana attenuata]
MSERIPGTLLAYIERNPKEIVNVVTLRSGQVLKDLTPIQKDMRHEKESREQLKSGVKKKKEENSRSEEPEAIKHMTALPFPQKLSREKLHKQFERFLDMLAYAKFLKEILTKKRKIEEASVVKLTEHCSAILQNKLPQKKLEQEIGEIRYAPISLQLSDQTTITSEGIVEGVLVRVDKFVFPVDFIVVNMEENKEVPLILERPFLATGRAILDIQERKLILRVGEETDFQDGCNKGGTKGQTSCEYGK